MHGLNDVTNKILKGWTRDERVLPAAHLCSADGKRGPVRPNWGNTLVTLLPKIKYPNSPEEPRSR
eukprot:5904788-Lingulodinium_polyedra.AAC.1